MLKFFKYRLPFRFPFVTGNGTFKHRDGIIVTAQHNHFTAYGEIAPLPGNSSTILKRVAEILIAERKTLEKILDALEFEHFLEELSERFAIPELIFGLNTLYADYNARKSGENLAEFLGGSLSEKVHCNAVLGSGSLKQNLEEAEKYTSDGFRTLKLKVGVDAKSELDLIGELRRLYPDVGIRLDANQAWKVEEAVDFLRRVEGYDIEYCEQPVNRKNLDELAEIRSKTGVKIAADESLRNYSDAVKLIDAAAVDIFVIKPMLFGSYHDIRVTKNLAEGHDIEVVFTTSLEHLIGRGTTAILAALLGSKKYAHGLATASLFEPQSDDVPEIMHGDYLLNHKAGHGLEIKIDGLEEFG